MVDQNRFAELSARLAFFDDDQGTDIMTDLTHLIVCARTEKWTLEALQRELADFLEINAPSIDDDDHLEVLNEVLDRIPGLLGL